MFIIYSAMSCSYSKTSICLINSLYIFSYSSLLSSFTLWINEPINNPFWSCFKSKYHLLSVFLSYLSDLLEKDSNIFKPSLPNSLLMINAISFQSSLSSALESSNKLINLSINSSFVLP